MSGYLGVWVMRVWVCSLGDPVKAPANRNLDGASRGVRVTASEVILPR